VDHWHPNVDAVLGCPDASVFLPTGETADVLIEISSVTRNRSIAVWMVRDVQEDALGLALAAFRR